MARITLHEIASLVGAHGLPVIGMDEHTEDYDATVYLTDRVHIQCISSTEFCLVQEVTGQEDPEKMAWRSSKIVELPEVIKLASAALSLTKETSRKTETEH